MSQPLAQNLYELQEDTVFWVILFLHLTNTTDVSCRLSLLPRERQASTDLLDGWSKLRVLILFGGWRKRFLIWKCVVHSASTPAWWAFLMEVAGIPASHFLQQPGVQIPLQPQYKHGSLAALASAGSICWQGSQQDQGSNGREHAVWSSRPTILLLLEVS